MKRYVGRPIRRVEDYRFLNGTGRYTDDLRLEGARSYFGSVHPPPSALAKSTLKARRA